MIIVRVELHSAVTGRITELARMRIHNDGTGTATFRNYVGVVFRGRDKQILDKETVQKISTLKNHPSERVHIWNLVAKILTNLGYGQEK